jgi:hypothetical protein
MSYCWQIGARAENAVLDKSVCHASVISSLNGETKISRQVNFVWKKGTARMEYFDWFTLHQNSSCSGGCHRQQRRIRSMMCMEFNWVARHRSHIPCCNGESMVLRWHRAKNPLSSSRNCEGRHHIISRAHTAALLLCR